MTGRRVYGFWTRIRKGYYRKKPDDGAASLRSNSLRGFSFSHHNKIDELWKLVGLRTCINIVRQDIRKEI